MSVYSPSDDMEAPVRSESQDDSEEEEEYSQDDSPITHATNHSANPNQPITAVASLHSLNHLRSVGTSNAVCWTLSSAKPGNGVESLRDPSCETYWQSDGICQPHWVQLSFRRRLPILYVALFLDFQLDESYTPKTISIETGMSAQDACSSDETAKLEFHEPTGWVIVPVVGCPDPLDGKIHPVKAHMLRINILSMHQNGRDCHVRNLKVFCERNAQVPPMRQRLTNKSRSSTEEEDDDDCWDYKKQSVKSDSTSNNSSGISMLGSYATIR